MVSAAEGRTARWFHSDRLVLERLALGFGSVAAVLGVTLWVTRLATDYDWMFGVLAGMAGVLFLSLWPVTRDRVIAAVAGGVGAVASVGLGPPSLTSSGVLGGAAIGVVALAVLWRNAASATAKLRLSARSLLVAIAAVWGVGACSAVLTTLTATLLPETLDRAAYAADAGFGSQVSFVVGAFLLLHPALRALASTIYLWVPLPLAWVVARQLGRERRPVAFALSFLAVSMLAGEAFFFVFPLAGPIFAFRGYFPGALPTPEQLSAIAAVPEHTYRNCMPSIHTVWALALVWYTREDRAWIRGGAWAWLALTELATLGFGYHYTIDLVAAVPFAVAAQALVTMRATPLEAARRRALAAGVTCFVGWVLFVRLSPGTGVAAPWLQIPLALVVVVVPWVFEARLNRVAVAAAAPSVAVARKAPEPGLRAVAMMFFASGFAALIYEVLYGKLLAHAFGNTSRANATVLTTYMGGLALGAWLGGRWGGERARNSLRLYAGLEITIGVVGGLSPFVAPAVTWAYVALAAGTRSDAAALPALQVGLGALLLLPPTILMGATLPVLFRHLAPEASTSRRVGFLDALNTAGAAAGALLTGYAILPALGVTQSAAFAAVCNLAVAFAALRLSLRAPEAQAAPDQGSRPAGPRLAVPGMAALFLIGFVSLALESDYLHLLAVVVGNSTYAFSVMLVTFLIGLALGGGAAQRLASVEPAQALTWLALALAAVIGAQTLGWNLVPAYFASFQGYPAASTFASREVVRFAVCLVFMVPPAAIIGAIYPLAIQAAAGPQATSAQVGRAAAVNTLGNVLGALVGGLLLIDRLGGVGTQLVLATIALVLAFTLAAVRGFPWRAMLAVALTALALGAMPREPDYSRLTTGANVYFADQHFGRVIAHAESAEGGLTTVNVNASGGREYKTLLTNGKFQGSDLGETEAQFAFGLIPLRHVDARGRALVIGYGTGASARVVTEAGFASVDIAELSRNVVDVADAHFGELSGHVVARPNVHLEITDGRNFLALSRDAYDLISIEITSIWFAGAANLYNLEFYELAKRRLSDRGVLRQWVQLHHITPEALATVIATFAEAFPETWLYVRGGQGVLVGCLRDCAPTPSRDQALDQSPGLRTMLPTEGAARFQRDLVMTPDLVRQFVQGVSASVDGAERLISTDDTMRLEFLTPRGNVLDAQASADQSMRLLVPHAPPLGDDQRGSTGSPP